MLGLFRQTEDDRRRELLSSYIDGELTDDELREVEEILASSGDARKELAGLKMSVALLGQLPELKLPRSFKLDILPEQQKSPWWSSLWATGLATSMAAMILVALVTGDMLNVFTQTRAAAIESLDSVITQQAASSAAFEEAADSAVVVDEPTTANRSAVTQESTADLEPPAAAPSIAAAAPASAGAGAAAPQPETSVDTQELAAPQARTLSAPPIAGTSAQEDDPDAPVPAPLAAPAGAPGIASVASVNTNLPEPKGNADDGTAKASEESVVSTGASVEALALPAPAAISTQSAEDQVPLTIGGEGSDAGALAIASAPAPNADDEVAKVATENFNAPLPATAIIDSQSVEPMLFNDDLMTDEGIELPLRQLQIGTVIVVLLLATGSVFVTRRPRTVVA